MTFLFSNFIFVEIFLSSKFLMTFLSHLFPFNISFFHFYSCKLKSCSRTFPWEMGIKISLCHLLYSRYFSLTNFLWHFLSHLLHFNVFFSYFYSCKLKNCSGTFPWGGWKEALCFPHLFLQALLYIFHRPVRHGTVASP